MDLETAVKLGQLVFMVAQVGVLVLMLVMRSTFASKKDAGAAHSHAEKAHNRLDVLDERLRGFPGYDVTNELREDFAKLDKSQAEVATEVRMLRQTVQRMDEFLRAHK